jgi:CHAT domain-containing protein/Tfp pilus assembly protein PilF
LSHRRSRTLLVAGVLSLAVHHSVGGQGPGAAPQDGGGDRVASLAAALLEASTAAERDDLLAGATDLVTADLWRALITIGEQSWLRADREAALATYAIAQSVAERIDDRAGVAVALARVGRVHADVTETQTATDYYRKALALAESSGDPLAIAQVLSDWGNLHYNLADFELAVASHQRALALRRAAGDRFGVAYSISLLGNVDWARADYASALERYGEALALFESLGDRTRQAMVLTNLGAVRLRLAQYGEARKHLESALAIHESLGQTRPMTIVLTNLGNLHYDRGDNARAMEMYFRALRLRQEMGSAGAYELSNIAGVYREQGRYALAVDYFARALDAFEASGEELGMGDPLTGLAETSLAEGRTEIATEYGRRALELYQRMGSKSGIAATWRLFAAIEETEGRYETALEHYRRSLDQYDDLGSRSEVVDVMTEMAEIAELRGQTEEVLELATGALEVAVEVGYHSGPWRLQTLIGRAHQRMGRREEARRALEDAIASVEALRDTAAGGEEDRQSFFEGKVAPYRLLVSLLVEQGDTAEAFAVMERTKARALLDVLARGGVEIAGAMTDDERARERSLQTELASFNASLRAERAAEGEDRERVAELERRVERARLDLVAFRGELYATRPELAVSRGETRPITLAETAALLRDRDRALVSFLVTDDATYSFVVSQPEGKAEPRLATFTIPVARAEVERRTEALRSSLGRLDPRFAEEARGLYDLLLRPAEEELRGTTSLVVVPDGVLWELPFQALQPAAGRYLIEERALSYAPSLTVLRAMEARRRSATRTSRRTLLAMGNPDFGPETRERAERVLLGGTLHPLPDAEHQVRALAGLYGREASTVYVGAEAREDRAKTEAGGYRILQFATHGTLNDVSPMYSHLVLAHPEDSAEDGLLEAWEMMSLDLDADLVVLAACETARGRVPAGEGVVGMSWALFVAGASTTVVSQWKVESASTTELMLAFHRALARTPEGGGVSTPAAQAMREAALALLGDSRYRHPFHWAGFVVVGAT